MSSGQGTGLARLARLSVAVAIAIALGRVSGFIREIALSRAAGGATSYADTGLLLLTFPDFLVGLALSGALAAALVPEFQRIGRERASALFVQCSLLILIVMALMAAAAALAAPQLIHVLAPGLPANQVTDAVPMFRLMLWAVPLTALSGVTTAWLNSSDKFVVPAAGTLMFNLAVIVSILTVRGPADLPRAIMIGVVVGAVARLMSQLAQVVCGGRNLQGRRVNGWCVAI